MELFYCNFQEGFSLPRNFKVSKAWSILQKNIRLNLEALS